MFNHFNPLDIIEDYKYYIRCIERFRRLLKKEEHKLFIMTLPNVNNMDEDRKNEIIEFNKAFANYTDKDKYTLLVIFHFSYQNEISHELTIVDNIHFLRLNTFSASNGVHFWDVNDTEYLVKLILETYNFNLLNI